jgi:hypothetical protein
MSNTTGTEIDPDEAVWICLIKKQALMRECHALPEGSVERAQKHAEWSAMARLQHQYEALAALSGSAQ